ncbi:hypothetical protein LSAT2_013267 [Lamellibrachia satsuma]|nr:hypothetical protein LSAT2_013267 [Lamellibrachia satsuma]
MKNLYKLKNKGKPFSGMIVEDDMSKDDREKEQSLQEAREKSMQEETTNVIHLVQGQPGERHITKVKKRGVLTNQARALGVPELEK